MAGFALPRSYADVACYLVEPLSGDFSASVTAAAADGAARLEAAKQKDATSRGFGLLLADGLSIAEERLTGQLHAAFHSLPLIGGSAGDDGRFQATHVYWNGRFRSDAAVLIHAITDRPFHEFKTQHFTPTDKKLVITAAIPERRIVTEINGYPAAQEYAKLVGLHPDELAAQTFSRHPVMLRIGGEYYVRSIQQANPDGSLTFYCAIDEGLVLTIAECSQMVEKLAATFEDVLQKIPQPELILCCECILRRLEVLGTGLQPAMDELLSRNRVIGFHTYGEQFGAVHVNQTLTGLVLGG